jgi:hypothetical protein
MRAIQTFLFSRKVFPMTLKSLVKAVVIFCGLMALTLSTQQVTSAPALPNPVLIFTNFEPYETGGKTFIRYRYDVFNKDAYPADMFAAAPALPPCGKNTKASRTWVDVYDQSGKRLYGFCAFSKPSDLGSLWFALEMDVIPPSWIYIEMTDRQTNTKYKSNLAETTN